MIVVAVDKVGGIDERLLGGADSEDEDCTSEKSVKVEMALEEAATDGAERVPALDPWLCSVRSVKVDIDEESCAWSSMRDTESSLKSTNVTEEAGDGTPYDLCSLLDILVGVNFSAGE